MAQPNSGFLYPRNLVRVAAASAVSATANTTGVSVAQFGGNGVTLIFDCSATSGAGSLAIAVEQAAAVGGTYAPVPGATITVNASGVQTLFVPNVSQPFIRLAQTLTGTSVTYSALCYGHPQDATVSGGFTTAPAA